MRDIVCMQCKYHGRPRRKKRGSTKMEAAGWMVFPLGIPYSLWRMFSRYPVCPHCGGQFIVAADSIMGLRTLKLMQPGEPALSIPALQETGITPPVDVQSHPKPAIDHTIW